MKRAIVIGLLLILGSVPSAAGYHLSAGGEERVLVDSGSTGPVQTSDNEPTVTDADRQVGTSTDCKDPDAELDGEAAEDAQDAIQRDPFCGLMVYNEGTGLVQVSPADQHYPEIPGDENPVDNFDVVRAYYSGPLVGFGCFVFCPNDPQGDTAWSAAHAVGSEAGVTDSEEDASGQENSDRTQDYSVAAYYPSAMRVAQWNTDAWRMNGPVTPSSLNMFIAFVEEEQSDGTLEPISDDKLDTLVNTENVLGQYLADNSKPTVCGMSPQLEFQSTAARASCETGFTFKQGDSPPGDDTSFDGYNDQCDSPTYSCNTASGGAWYSDFVCLNCDFAVQENYLTWHWFVAPHGAECGGAQEPGMSFDSDGADIPYLAHEVDVWTPSTEVESLAGPTNQANRGVTTLPEHSNELRKNVGADDQQEEVTGVDLSETVPGWGLIEAFNEDPVSTLPVPAGEEPEPENQQVPDALPARDQVYREEMVEPNAEPVGDVGDSSQKLTFERSLDDCTLVAGDAEDPEEHVDPWVSRVDAEAYQGSANQPGGDVLFWNDLNGVDGVGLYDSADDQDDANNPGPGMFFTRGNVGVFTDRNDNGQYEDINFGSKYDGSSILAEGAYPLLWDNYLNGDSEIDTEEGCLLPGDKPITEIMEKGGYGAETGLFQAIYLKEPTVFEWSSQQTSPTQVYQNGNDIHVLMSQSVRQLWEGPGEVDPDSLLDNDVDNAVDRAIESLQDYAVQQANAPSTPTVQVPGDDFNATSAAGEDLVTVKSDFQSQCSEDTGGFESQYSFLHNCETDCSGDTIVTGYVLTVEDDGDGDATAVLGGNNKVFDPLSVNGDKVEFPVGTDVWFDVDPFDGDADRNQDAGSTPPSD